MAAIGFVLDGKQYDVATVTSVKLSDTLDFDAYARRRGWLVEDGQPLTWQRVLQLIDSVTSTPAAAVAAQAGWALLVSVIVWASRRKAGDPVTLDDFGDFSLDDVEWMHDETPQDKPPAGPRVARPGSGRAGAKRSAKRTR